MTVTLHLSPEIEASLIAQAQAQGLSLDQFLSRKLSSLVSLASSRPETANAGEWEGALDEWFESFAAGSGLSEDALKRESWYADRW